MQKIIVEGHRGFCAKYPENTLVSFSRAIDIGVDAIEFDVWLSKDKVPVIMHDGNTYRSTGKDAYLRDLTLEEIKELDAGGKFNPEFRGEKVPALRELLNLVKSRKPELLLGVEIKEYTEETVELTVAMLKEFGFFEQCYFYCFNARILRYLKQKYNARTMGYPDFQMSEFTPDSYNYYDEIGIAVSIMHSEVFPIYQAKNLPMHIYCADDSKTVKEAIEHGATLITANNPLPLIEYIGKGE